MSEAVSEAWGFFVQGGFFMLLLIICSLVALTVIVYKLLTLRRERVIPPALESAVEEIESRSRGGETKLLEAEIQEGRSALARICGVAIRSRAKSEIEVQDAVQATAREEIVRMGTGLSVLEVVIQIAPLLGLLGTASGLVTVFGDLGGTGGAIGRGIAMALSTTIVGMAICVPSVIAHSYFSRKVETISARLEVLLGTMISARNQQSRTSELSS